MLTSSILRFSSFQSSTIGAALVGLAVCFSVEPLPSMVSPVVPWSKSVSLMMKQPPAGKVTVALAGTLARKFESGVVLSPCEQSDGMLAGNVTL